LRVNLAFTFLIAFVIPAFAHGIEERPGLGAGMTFILSAFWIVVAIGIVFFIRRLIRPDAAKSHKKDAARRQDTEDPK
jgi:hypothetical protein